MAASTASAATFSYVGTKLSPDLQGGTGAKAVTFSFLAPALPKPGKCVQALKLLKYADGARTLASLRKTGFQVINNGDTGPITFATVCLGKDGATVSGVYEITISRSVYPFTETYSITNGTANRSDLLEFLVYASGAPSVSSDVSATQGAWTIKH